ncbi:MAG TPA: hypothetical protein PLA16_04550 [Chitinophagales bacterium]|mgnify:FL=1|nr:hypothetical protein [Chitinophagales bacterium]HQO89798.1 hypothetical protein [Chitinophagales bacterium]
MTNKDLLIEKFLEHTLSAEEQLEFDRLLQSDTAFQQEFEFQKKLKASIIIETREKQKEQLRALEREIATPSRFKYAAAAAIILVVFAALIFALIRPDTDDLYASYYEPFPNLEKPTTRDKTATDLPAKAFYAYDTENYATAAALFDQIYTQQAADYAILYEGLSYMELGKFRQAIQTFELFDFEKQNNYTHTISWYLALCYLKNQQTERAKFLLEEVSHSDSQFKASSTELLEELN